MIEAIVKDLAPELLAQTAIGLNSAAQWLLTAGDNGMLLPAEFERRQEMKHEGV